MMQKMRSASLSSKKKAKNTVKCSVCLETDDVKTLRRMYYHHEARSLKAYGELPECIRPGGLDDGDDDGDDCVEFAEGEDFVDNI
ncbi:hypothetical protein Tco_0013873 [Tanacetum coccineum]